MIGSSTQTFTAAPRLSTRCVIGATMPMHSRRVRTQSKTTDSPDVPDMSENIEKTVKDLKKKWDDVEEKPAAIGLTVAALVGLYALNGVVTAVDSIPIVSPLLELVGIFVSAWFVYRYLIFGPDREELAQNVEGFFKKVAGK